MNLYWTQMLAANKDQSLELTGLYRLLKKHKDNNSVIVDENNYAVSYVYFKDQYLTVVFQNGYYFDVDPYDYVVSVSDDGLIKLDSLKKEKHNHTLKVFANALTKEELYAEI